MALNSFAFPGASLMLASRLSFPVAQLPGSDKKVATFWHLRVLGKFICLLV